MRAPIYLDHAATTPLRVEAREAMEPFLSENYANPSSVYRMAQGARSALDRSRRSIAECLGAKATEIVFTSGGTESNNAAIKGALLGARKRHLVTTAIEHDAVLRPVEEMTRLFGCEASIVAVPGKGVVDVAEVECALRPDTALLSVMWANNEIGTIQPIEALAELTQARGVAFHVDAVQAAGSLLIDLSRVPIDVLSLSAHKFGGPKGVGALFVREGVHWRPLLTGGGQERDRRSGTENVAGIVGMAKAFELAVQEREGEGRRLTELRDWLVDQVLARMPGASLNGERTHRLPNNANFLFPGVSGESLLVALDLVGVMASSGSACASGSLEASHVLLALGLDPQLARSSIRFTLGRGNTLEELREVVNVLVSLVERLRGVGSRPAPAVS